MNIGDGLRIACPCPPDRDHSLGHAPMLGLRPVPAQDLGRGFLFSVAAAGDRLVPLPRPPGGRTLGARRLRGGHSRAGAVGATWIGGGTLFHANAIGLVAGLTAAAVVAARALLALRLAAIASLTHLPRIAIGGLGRLRRRRHRAEFAFANRNLLPDQPLDIAQEAPFVVAAQRDGRPLGAGPRRAADPMDVSLGDVRDVEIDDMADAVDIDAARRDVRSRLAGGIDRHETPPEPARAGFATCCRGSRRP